MSTKYINKQSHASTLAFFRLAFGLMMLSSLIRFASFGWIKNYILIRNFILPIMDFNG
jgi:hypothetical protein